MRLIAALAISATILAAQSSRNALHSVTALRHWSLSDVTRIAIEVSGEFEIRSDRLHNPERLYFDILNARPRIDSRRIYSQEIRDKRVQKVRVAETAPGVTRIVLDLNGDVTATTSKLSTPDRLIIELRAGTPPATPTAAPTILPTAPAPGPLKPDTNPLPGAKPVNKPPVLAAAEPKTPPPAAAPEPKASETEEPVAGPAAKHPVETAAAAPATTPAAKPAVSATAATRTSRGELVVETATAAKHTSTGSTSLVRALGLKIGRVVIDPGHGGHDQGTEGVKGLLEKDLVMDVALRVGKLIEQRLGAEVIYTRTDDTFIPLEQRTAIANERKADLFLSIHANSSPAPKVTGVETYYRNMTTSKDALDVAARENATSQRSIADLEDLLHKVMIGDKVEESKEFAARMQAALYTFSARTFPGAKDRGVKKAPLVVLFGAKSPSVLVEIGFLSNTREESLLKRNDYRQKLAEALYRGVARYADSLSHAQQVAKAGSED